jgi:hypothetical protein
LQVEAVLITELLFLAVAVQLPVVVQIRLVQQIIGEFQAVQHLQQMCQEMLVQVLALVEDLLH